MKLKRLSLACLLCAVAIAQTETEPAIEDREVRAWIDKATHTNNPAEWAKYLMQADTAAEKLTRSKASGCCGNRCLRIDSFTLNYRFNPIEGQEDYQHDLLQLIAMVHAGTPDGADALVRLLPAGCQTIASQWTPYFRTVLGIVQVTRWKNLRDFRLIRIRAEAYETWWSMSKLTADDAQVTDAQLNPADFSEGASLARARAIQAYQELVKSGRADAEVMTSLRKLIAGQDTQMRKWVCFGD